MYRESDRLRLLLPDPVCAVFLWDEGKAVTQACALHSEYSQEPLNCQDFSQSGLVWRLPLTGLRVHGQLSERENSTAPALAYAP
ncbi:hypothetical protein GCM10008955_32240 [Deinococcus malanensis]|uniref:Uncharacterized protein n=1 Tax=Deinococcus malanensis TaxID=1706855 RepID=A0ABQ2F362_9DEIO|nr:hypothetical protein GCM10008955_32240 [Deinococcus malanensis]